MRTGDKLRNRRKELGLSMKEVADHIGVAEATVSRWESGDIANMKRNYIKLYADVLQVSPLFIMGEDEDSSIQSDEFNELFKYFKENYELQVLFKSSKGATKEQLERTISYLNFLKNSERE